MMTFDPVIRQLLGNIPPKKTVDGRSRNGVESVDGRSRKRSREFVGGRWWS